MIVVGDRTFEIVQNILDDAPTSATIARRMGITEDSVKTMLGKLYRKVGVHSRTELVLRLATREVQLVPQSGMTLR